MRRMVNINKIIKKPVLCYETDLRDESEILDINLENGDYLIDLHGNGYHNVAFLTVCEEEYSISTATLFNAGVVGTKICVYEYYKQSGTMEIDDQDENPVVVTGHIDIYKF